MKEAAADRGSRQTKAVTPAATKAGRQLDMAGGLAVGATDRHMTVRKPDPHRRAFLESRRGHSPALTAHERHGRNSRRLRLRVNHD
jgi:hypothetical protein